MITVKLVPMEYDKNSIAVVDSMGHTIIIINGIKKAKEYKKIYEKTK